jgi:hypothetical protein
MEESTEYFAEAFNSKMFEKLDLPKQMIIQLALKLDFTKYDYVLYLDNLFTNMPF